MSRNAFPDEPESIKSKLAESIEEESKDFSHIKSNMKSLDCSVTLEETGNWTEWNFQRCVSSVLWEINFWGQFNLEGLFEVTEDEEIKEDFKVLLSFPKSEKIVQKSCC